MTPTPPQASKPATMRDVAARAGVSRSLVSTVFRGVPGAGPETRERILAAAAELGYRPDDRARQLRSRDRRLIGVTLTATHSFHVAIAERMHDAAALHGYELSLSLSTDTRSLTRAVDTLLAQRCAALVLIGPVAPAAEISAIAALDPGMPVVVVDGHVDLPTIDAVRVDDAAGLMASISHLVGLGHKRIWHLDGGAYVSAEPRRAAYLSAMAAHGLADDARVLSCGGSATHGAAAATTLLQQADPPTAVACYNDRVATGLVNALWRSGTRIPEDLSVVGFDDIPAASVPHLSLTTVEQRPDRLVEEVARTVMTRLGGAPPRGLRLIPPGPLVVRSSTGPARLRAAG